MSDTYDVNGRLVRTECDSSRCAASIKPYPQIADSGWMKGCRVVPSVGEIRSSFCPACWPNVSGYYPDPSATS